MLGASAAKSKKKKRGRRAASAEKMENNNKVKEPSPGELWGSLAEEVALEVTKSDGEHCDAASTSRTKMHDADDVAATPEDNAVAPADLEKCNASNVILSPTREDNSLNDTSELEVTDDSNSSPTRRDGAVPELKSEFVGDGESRSRQNDNNDAIAPTMTEDSNVLESTAEAGNFDANPPVEMPATVSTDLIAVQAIEAVEKPSFNHQNLILEKQVVPEVMENTANDCETHELEQISAFAFIEDAVIDGPPTTEPAISHQLMASNEEIVPATTCDDPSTGHNSAGDSPQTTIFETEATEGSTTSSIERLSLDAIEEVATTDSEGEKDSGATVDTLVDAASATASEMHCVTNDEVVEERENERLMELENAGEIVPDDAEKRSDTPLEEYDLTEAKPASDSPSCNDSGFLTPIKFPPKPSLDRLVGDGSVNPDLFNGVVAFGVTAHQNSAESAAPSAAAPAAVPEVKEVDPKRVVLEGFLETQAKETLPDSTPLALFHAAVEEEDEDVALMTAMEPQDPVYYYAANKKSGTHFYDYLHPTVLQKGISEFLVTTLFTDVVLIVGSQTSPKSSSESSSSSSVYRFPAHRIVLSVKCRALRLMFEENPTQREFHLDYISDPDILFLMLSFIYSGKADFRRDSCKPLYAAAAAYDLPSLRKACQRYLVDNLSAENCLMAMRLGAEHGDEELESRARKHALKHFSRVCRASEFLELRCDELESLIQEDQLNIKTEERLYKAVVAWLNHDLPSRRRHAYVAMRWVRLPLLHRDFILNQVDEFEIMRSDANCRALLREAKQYLSPGNRYRIAAARASPRPSTGFESVFLLLAAKSSEDDDGLRCGSPVYRPASDDDYCSIGAMADLWAFHPRSSTLRQLSSVPWPLKKSGGKKKTDKSGLTIGEGAAVAAYGNDLFICGGFESNLMFRYHSELDSWSECATMKRARQHFAMATVGDAVYVIGGVTSGGTEPLASIDKYDIARNRWSTAGSLLWGVDSAASAVKINGNGSNCRGRIFVIGGSTLTADGDEMPASSMVQVFDVQSGLTLMATPLPVPAPDARCVMVDHSIYVLTGKNLFILEDEEANQSDEEGARMEDTVDDVETALSDGGPQEGDGDEEPQADAQPETAHGALHLEPSGAVQEVTFTDEVQTAPKAGEGRLVGGGGDAPQSFPTPVRSSTPPVTVEVQWKQLSSIPSTTNHTTLMTTASALLGNIYLFGGFRNRHVYVYNTSSGRWDTGETVGDELGTIRPIGSACIIAPTQVFGLEQCRSPRGGSIKVIPRRKKVV